MSSISSPSPLQLDLSAHLVPGLPSSVLYFASFLPKSTCDAIITSIQSTPPHRWAKLAHRRLLSLPRPLTGKSRDTLLASASLPDHLTNEILPKFKELGIFNDSPHGAPNHVLVNEYLPGQGIMPHEDGPAYHPVTATVSLGSSTVLDIYSKGVPRSQDSQSKHWRILQEPGSLLVTMEDCYTDTMHGIAEIEVDENVRNNSVANWDLLGDKDEFPEGKNTRKTRVSLTYRDVKKVVQVGGGRKNNVLGKR
jgi:alkylated DNA repair protein alkB homolog 6